MAGLVLTMGGLVGCGGGDGDSESGGLPRDASSADFCANFEQLAKDLGAFTADSDPADAIAQMQDASEEMRATGVPESATDEQAEGLEVTLEAIDGIDPDSSLEDLSGIEDQFSEAEQEKADAFDDYLDEECGEIG
ncbi:hypothetical protein JCM10369A_31420 [Nocardioides pyridinolyticus]